MKKLTIILISFLGIGHSAYAQMQVDKQMQMNGPTNTDKQITGVGNPGGPDHAVNVGNIQSGSLVYAVPTGSGGSYFVTLNPAPDPVPGYVAGMVVNFTANHNNPAGVAQLNVNSLGFKNIRKNVSNTLAANDIVSGQAVSVMYDGTNFQLLSRTGTGAGQVIYGFNSTAHSTTSTTYVNSGISVTITPTSTTSKVLITIHSSGNSGTNVSCAYTIARGATNLSPNGDFFQIFNGTSQFYNTPFSISFLDSPNTTSAVTYNLQFRRQGSFNVTTDIVYVNSRPFDGAAYGATQITATEILQ